MKPVTVCFVFLMMIAIFTPADATLIDRGGGLIYDDAMNVTWLWDANYVLTKDYGVTHNNDGTMHWSEAGSWANTLDYAGYSDWRLPSASPTASDSEMYQMFYTNLSGTSSNPISGTSDSDYDLFVNLHDNSYASNTEVSGNTSHIYDFNFGNGTQSTPGKNTWFYAWAVRDGDSSPVPEPASLFLLVTGLLGLAWGGRKKN